MYNSYLVEKRDREHKQTERERKRVCSWVKRYHTTVQPELVQKYNRRVNGFIKKIEQKPIVIHEEQSKLENTFRSQNKQTFLSQQNFKFKDSSDWKSLFNPIERVQRESKIKFQEKNGDPNLALRSIGSQSKYSPAKFDFRPREEEKEINPPMKYTNKNILANMKGLPKLMQKKKHRKPDSKQSKKKVPFSRESMTNSKQERESDTANISDLDILSMNNSSFLRKEQPHEKTQKQRVEEQELKALARKRMYFKRVIDIEQNNKDQKAKNTLRNLLVKCGIFKAKPTQHKDVLEVDHFLEYLKDKFN